MDEINHIGQLKPDPNNARKHNQRNIGQIVSSLQEVGAARSIVIDEDNIILAGNGVIEAAGIAGIENVRVIEADGNEIIAVKRKGLTPEQKTRLALWDNRAAELAEWDIDQLQIEFDAGMLEGLFSDIDLDKLGLETKGEPQEDAEPQIDKAEELRVKWGVELGQLWQLGEHRLICGDCTDKAVVDRVMDGEKADMVFTDPPYPNNSDIMEKMIDISIKAFYEARSICDGYMFWFWDFLTEPPYKEFVNARHVWHKTNGWQAGHWEAINQYCGDKNRRESWVYSFPNVGENVLLRESVGDHPTPKPVDLVEKILSENNGEIVADFFLGSGTTLIACERLNRKCRAVEISPAYCAVAIQRWVDVTGQEPVLLET